MGDYTLVCIEREREEGGETFFICPSLYTCKKYRNAGGGGTLYSVDKNINVYLLIANPRIYFRL